MKNETHTRYRLTWKSDSESFRKDAFFRTLELAKEWYEEKLAEGKSPQLWKEETTITFEALLPQEDQ